MRTYGYMMLTALLFGAVPLSGLAHDGTNHDGGGATEGGGVSEAVQSLSRRGGATMTPEEERQARNYFTDLPVIDQNGRALRFYSDVLRGRVVLIDFIFTNCENSCPATTAMLNTVRRSLGERFGKEVFFISVSVDPERDTPEAMRAFARKLEADVPGWLFLTGDKPNLETIVRKLGQYTENPAEHSMLMLAGNVPAKHWTKITPMTTVPQLVLKLETLATRL